MVSIRPAAVAGAFYPGDARELADGVRGYLAAAPAPPAGAAVPKVVVAPHAGHVYSGPVAASAYALLRPGRDRIRRVVLIGPSHRVAFRGVALTAADAYETPLGRIPVDRPFCQDLARAVRGVAVFDPAHAPEHSLEVHLPFLQEILGDFALVPLVTGEFTPAEVAAVLEAAWGGPETVVVVSTDLSHFLDYDTCRRVDAGTTRAIEALDPEAIGRDQACGGVPVRGLLVLAKRRGLSVVTLDVRNSGDTAGPRDRVVGYGSWAFFEPDAAVDAACPVATAAGSGTDGDGLLARRGAALLHLAAASIRHGLAHRRAVSVDMAVCPPDLAAHGAAFVTLNLAGQLRGCIGSPLAWRPLVEDVADNAFKAAFHDPRFQPLAAVELAGLDLSVSVLSEPRPMAFADEDDLLCQMRPGIDGLIFEDGNRRGLFLPQVWEMVPDPVEFLGHLKRKAGLAPDHWSPTVVVRRFTAGSVKSDSLPDPAALWRMPERV